MNPQFDPTPGLHLPEPSSDQRPMAVQQQQAASLQPLLGQQPQTVASQPMLQSAQEPIATAMPQPLEQNVPAVPIQPVANSMPTSENMMDEAWINKAKAAVEQFHSDPYNESNALSKIRAEYLKSRHNIVTKLSDSHEL